MFRSSTEQIVKSVGKDTLTPVTSLDQADKIFPLALIIKEERKKLVFWKRFKYIIIIIIIIMVIFKCYFSGELIALS